MHNDQHIKRLQGEEAKALNELIQLCISQGVNCTPEEKLAVVRTICLTNLLNTEEKLRVIDIIWRSFNPNINPNAIVDEINEELRAISLNPLL